MSAAGRETPEPGESNPLIGRAILLAALAGLSLVSMNACMRVALQSTDPFVAQFFRYLFGLMLALPFMLRAGFGWLRPNNLGGQLWRGLTQTVAITLFNLALRHLPLADAVAIMFVVPIAILVGAWMFLGERVNATRWMASLLGLLGVLIVLSPKLTGAGPLSSSLVMLASVPFWAATFLITKALTRSDPPSTIVAWQNLSITALMLPMALFAWQTPGLTELALTAGAGLFGTLGHWLLTRAFSLADVSALQPIRFLDLLWSALFGIALFGEPPVLATLVGGVVIVTATVWLARSERARN
jgi:drug/metabolite transporter (DMT)-like permease